MADSIILVQEEPRGPSQLIEIPVTLNGSTKIVFPDIQQLRSDETQRIVIKSMRLITADVLTNAMITSGVNAVFTELQKISMVIYSEGWEKGQLIPLLTLNDMTYAGSAFPHRYHQTRFANWQKVDWSKSYLQYANGQVSAGAPYIIMFDVEYSRLKLDGGTWKEVVGPA